LYHQTPTAHWDVDPKDATKVDEEAQEGLVGFQWMRQPLLVAMTRIQSPILM